MPDPPKVAGEVCSQSDIRTRQEIDWRPDHDLREDLAPEQRKAVLEFQGHLYATLDFEPPESKANGPSELPGLVPLPDGWEIAPDTIEVLEEVAGKHSWGTSLLVTRTGCGFSTTNWPHSGSKISNFELAVTGGDRYGPRRCLPSRPSRVLIRYPAGKDPDILPIVAGPPTAEIFVKAGKKPPRGFQEALANGADTEAAGAEPPLPIALLFPGQGSQYVKMLNDVKDLPAVRSMLEKANEILGYDILEICLNGPEEKLEETRYCQPALFIAGLAGVEKLREEREEAVTRAQVMAGLSLGEYTALCAAGVFTFEEGLKLVQLRGEAMQEAAAVGQQAMLSVAGLSQDRVEQLCEEAAAEAGPEAVCQIANFLFPQGVSVGGSAAAVELLKAKAEKAGALQAKVLKTAGAFHTPLMRPAQERLSAALEEALPKMRPPRHAVCMNVTAECLPPGTDPATLVDLLRRQLTSPVLWEACVCDLIDRGVAEFYEVGPMKQLTAMMKRISPKAWKSTLNVSV